jgi:hypothetical protein
MARAKQLGSKMVAIRDKRQELHQRATAQSILDEGTYALMARLIGRA